MLHVRNLAVRTTHTDHHGGKNTGNSTIDHYDHEETRRLDEDFLCLSRK